MSQRPGRKQAAPYPTNIFNTWLDYRESLGHSQADTIRLINKRTGRSYDNSSIYKWKTGHFVVPPIVYEKVINKDMPDLLSHVFEKAGIDTTDIKMNKLAAKLSIPIKTDKA